MKLKDLENKWETSIATHDAATVRSLLADSLVGVVPMVRMAAGKGSGKSMVPYPNFHTGFPKVVDAAFAQFSRNLAQMKR